MRFRVILGTALSALLLAGAITQPAVSQAATPLTASSITAPAQTPPDKSAQPAPSRLAWYADPIVLAFALAAVFAAIDIAMMFSKQSSPGRKTARA